jgi:tRNA (cmo5U34)-methyltransferase
MKANSSSEIFFDKISDDYSAMIKRCVPRYEEMLLKLMGYLPNDLKANRILELGCGTGNLTNLIIKRFPDAKIVAVDLSGELLAAAKDRFKLHHLINYRQEDFRNLQFESDNFDLVISSISIHHLKDNEKKILFSRCFNWLSSGGFFSFSDQFSSPLATIYSANMEEWHNQAIAMGSFEPEWAAWMEHQLMSDFHSPIQSEIEWLSNKGFANIDVTWRYLLWGNIIANKA